MHFLKNALHYTTALSKLGALPLCRSGLWWEIIDREPYNMPPNFELKLQKLLSPTEEVKIPPTV